MQAKKKLLSSVVAGTMMLASISQAMAAPVEYGEELKNAPSSSSVTVSFTDVNQTHWAYSFIADMVGRKILEGYPDQKFRPDRQVTRAEFATIIVKASGIQPKKVNYSSFSDLKVTDWSSPYVETVKDYMTGYRTADSSYIFNPDAPALREDMTVALVKLKGYDVARLSNRSIIEAMFKDYDGISEAAKDYVAVAVENGLVSGYEDETFRPQATVTRAEAATMLFRAFQYGNDNKGIGRTTATIPSATKMPTASPKPTPTATPKPADVKFSVDTLVGGIGQGDVDGPVSIAKINTVDSMALDQDDNVYFLDSKKKKVRKFTSSNGTVSTLSVQDSNITNSHALGTQSQYQTISYNLADRKLYLSSLKANLDRSNSVLIASIHEIYPTVQTVTYTPFKANDDDRVRDYLDSYTSFIGFDNSNHIYQGVRYQSTYWKSDYRSLIIQTDSTTEGSVIASSADVTGPAFEASQAIFHRDGFYVLDKTSRTLTKTELFPRKVDPIAAFSTIAFDSLSSFNGKFYASSGTTIYEIGLDGNISTFVNGKDLTYNDGNKLTKISQFAFDTQGNVILYDDQNKAIRRINL